MRLALFSDIHGNPYATQAVLDAVAQDGAFDQVVCAGDLCFGGSDPAGCVDLLRAENVKSVIGNTDHYVLHPQAKPSPAISDEMWQFVVDVAGWTAKRLGEQRLNWLADLPFELRYQPTHEAKDELLIVHANPKDLEAILYPPPADQQELLGKVPQPDDDPALAALLADVSAETIAFGHLHHSSLRHWGGKRLVNVASASLPEAGQDRAARYTVFEHSQGQWRIQRRRVTYDYSQEAQALRASDLPDRENFSQRFED